MRCWKKSSGMAKTAPRSTRSSASRRSTSSSRRILRFWQYPALAVAPSRDSAGRSGAAPEGRPVDRFGHRAVSLRPCQASALSEDRRTLGRRVFSRPLEMPDGIYQVRLILRDRDRPCLSRVEELRHREQDARHHCETRKDARAARREGPHQRELFRQYSNDYCTHVWRRAGVTPLEQRR